MSYGAIALGVLVATSWAVVYRPPPPAGTIVPLFLGVEYQRLLLPQTADGGGEAHLIKIDLNAPGVEFFIRQPVARHDKKSEYHLDYPWAVARREKLAVAINGVLFHNDTMRHFDKDKPRWLKPFYFPVGDISRPNEPLVLDQQPSHYLPYAKLVWMDGHHRLRVSPPLSKDKTPLHEAIWAIGSQFSYVHDGKPNDWSLRNPDAPHARTVIGVDPETSVLRFAVFAHANRSLISQTLHEAGWVNACGLDGGGSTTMVIGSGAAGLRPGTLLAGQRPVAVTVGIRATPMP